MRTLQELYDQIKGDDEQKGAFVEAMRAGHATDFLRERGCDATEGELEEFLAHAAVREAPLELDDDAIREVAGGTAIPYPTETANCQSAACTNTCGGNCC